MQKEPNSNSNRYLPESTGGKIRSEATSEAADLAHKLLVLNNCFEEWRADDQAASDNDEGFDDGDGDE